MMGRWASTSKRWPLGRGAGDCQFHGQGMIVNRLDCVHDPGQGSDSAGASADNRGDGRSGMPIWRMMLSIC